MTTNRRDERGGVLLGVMLLTMMLAAISVTMGLSGQTELLIARTDESTAQAHAAAEAGLNHAVDVALPHLQQWQSLGYASPSDGVTALLAGPDGVTGTAAKDADNGSLEDLGLARPPGTLPLADVYGTGYEVRVLDEDDPARGITLSATDITRIGEDGAATTDGNTGVIVQSIGYGPGATKVTLEATIGSEEIPALLVGGSLTLDDQSLVDGSQGDVHANGDLTVDGQTEISGDATATGLYSESGQATVGGVSGAGFEALSIPTIQAVDYRPNADFIMTADGRVTDPAGSPLCDASAVGDACADSYGWTFNGAVGGPGAPGGLWELTNAQHPGGTFYIEGEAEVSASPGSIANPIPLTVIAERSIDVSGRLNTVSDSQSLALVTDMDLRITVSGNFTIQGQLLVHEQLEIDRTGNIVGTIIGQVTVEDAPSVSDLVTTNLISGSTTITYDGGMATGLTVTAWRESR
jgi:cytoskeletal protein CcmA (bactofilin family)